MRENFNFIDDEGMEINVYKWIPEDTTNIKGVVQISHGMAENALRYDYFAQKLCERNYIVYANDHRGHGYTAKTKKDFGYISDSKGFNALIKNMKDLNDIIKKENIDKKIILFGHSMGSFLSQGYIEKYGETIEGLILSGSNGKPSKLSILGIILSKIEMGIKGRRNISYTMDKLSFQDFNKKFKPNRTNFDWLCSVETEVDKYIKDEYCGFVCTSSFYYDLLCGLIDINKNKNKKLIPKDIPIYIFSGDKDPVGNFGNGIINLYNSYLRVGIRNVDYKLYKDGRHEMLNEFNKDEVINELIDWIQDKIK